MIRIGFVINNFDPKGLGRIRFKVPGQSGGAIEGSVNYTEWDLKDPFCALPFLPNNINFIPEVGQTVKIISYDESNELVNQEYIAGPFATVHDYNLQTNAQQVAFTTYGVAMNQPPDIFKKDSRVPNEGEVEGSIAKLSDYQITGKYGSDILFTTDGLQLRGGKLFSKSGLSDRKRQKMLHHPLMSDNQSKLILKKFGTKKELKVETQEINEIPYKKLKYVIEYDVDDVDNPTEIKIYAYKVKDVYGDSFRTDAFTSSTFEDLTNVTTGIILVNKDGTMVTPTHTISVTTQQEAYIELRTLICNLNEDGLGHLDSEYNNGHDDVFPFYFRPSLSLKNKSNSFDFLGKVKPQCCKSKNRGAGLMWSSTESSPKPKKKKIEVNVTKETGKNKEQTFATLIADKTFLLSTDNNETGKKTVPFKDLNRYDIEHDEYLTKIEPNTYAVVRGETLIEFLRAVVTVIEKHRHNPTKTMVTNGFKEYDVLKELVNSLENDILNKSIRIN